MRSKNLIHELIPAEKRLAKIDEIDKELERRWAAKEISLTEYVETKQPLTVKRFKEFRLVERARGWNRLDDIDVPEKVPIEPEPEALEPVEVEPVAIGQRLLGLGVFVVLMVALTWVWCWFSQT